MRNRGTYLPGLIGTSGGLQTIPDDCCLYPGDYVLSENGIFCAMALVGGGFAILKGVPDNNAGPIWTSSAGSYLFTNSLLFQWNAPAPSSYFALAGVYAGYELGNCDFTAYASSPVYVEVYDDYDRSDPKAQNLPWSITCQFHTDPNSTPLTYSPASGQIYWQVSDEGQFVIFSGTDPLDSTSAVIAKFGPLEKIASVVIQSLQYVTDAGVFSPSGTGMKAIYTSEVQTNATCAPGNSINLNPTQDVSFTSGWSNSFSVENEQSVSLGGSVSTDEIPFIDVEGNYSVEKSTSVTTSKELDGSTSWDTSFSFGFTFTVPPYTVQKGIAQIIKGMFSVPFTITGLVTFASGGHVTLTGTGVYTGDNCYNVLTSIIDVGYSLTSIEIDPLSGYSGSFYIRIVSPLRDNNGNEVIVWTSESTPIFGPGQTGTIDLLAYNLNTNCFFIQGEQTSYYPVFQTSSDGQTSDGPTISGPKKNVYYPTPGNNHVAVYACSGSSAQPTCAFDATKSG